MSAIALKRLRSLQMRNWDPFWVSLYAQNWRLFGRAKSKKRKEFAGCLVHIPVHPFSGALDLITLGKKIGVSNGINFISSSGRMEKKNLDPIKIQDIHFFCQCSQGGAHLGPVADQLQGTYIIFSGCGFQSGLHLLCFACPLPCLCGFSPGTAIISSHIAKAEDFHLSLSIQMFFSHLIGSPPLSNSFASYLNQRIILSRPMPTLKSLILMEIQQVSLISLYQLMRPVDLDITFSKWKTNKNNNNKKKIPQSMFVPLRTYAHQTDTLTLFKDAHLIFARLLGNMMTWFVFVFCFFCFFFVCHCVFHVQTSQVDMIRDLLRVKIFCLAPNNSSYARHPSSIIGEGQLKKRQFVIWS